MLSDILDVFLKIYLVSVVGGLLFLVKDIWVGIHVDLLHRAKFGEHYLPSLTLGAVVFTLVVALTPSLNTLFVCTEILRLISGKLLMGVAQIPLVPRQKKRLENKT